MTEQVPPPPAPNQVLEVNIAPAPAAPAPEHVLPVSVAQVENRQPAALIDNVDQNVVPEVTTSNWLILSLLLVAFKFTSSFHLPEDTDS